MPKQLILHETDPLTLHGVSNHAGRPSFFERNGRECFLNLVQIMALDLTGCPPERTPLIGEWFQVHNFFYGAETLNLVVIHNGDEIIQLVLWREQNWFPG